MYLTEGKCLPPNHNYYKTLNLCSLNLYNVEVIKEFGVLALTCTPGTFLENTFLIVESILDSLQSGGLPETPPVITLHLQVLAGLYPHPDAQQVADQEIQYPLGEWQVGGREGGGREGGGKEGDRQAGR